MQYTHTQLLLNGKINNISSILQGDVTGETEFEKATLLFIKRWLNGQQHFTLQTSGSTGTPKKIEVSREQLIASARATLQALSLQENNSALICLPTQYVAGIMMLVRCLIGNLSITAIDPTSNPLKDLDPAFTFDFAAMVPYQVSAIIQEMGPSALNRISKIIIGGAPIPKHVEPILAKSASSVYQTYGMTETLSHIALQKISGVDRDDYFTVLPNVHISTDDRNCLVIQTNFLTESIITNDVVDILSPTTFRWLGRADHIINSGGIKIFPEKVEEVIFTTFEELSLNHLFFVAGIHDDVLGSKAVLIIESEQALDETRLIQRLKAQLKAYEVPKQIFYVQAFAITPTGKINRPETLRKLGL